MRSLTPSFVSPARLVNAIGCGIAVLGCASAAMVAPINTVRDLGTLGRTYSFAIDINKSDQVMGHAFTASNAVQHTTLSSTSGSVAFGPGALDATPSLAIGIDNSGQVVGYAYRVNNAVQHATLFSTSRSTNTDVGTLGGSYSYARETDNNLWWAVPH